jgi:hypothetical protein
MFKKERVVSLLDVVDFTQLLHDAVHEERCERVRAACDRVEEFLSHAGKEVRDMLAIEIFESIQNDLYSSGSETLARFLGPETKRLCAEVQAIWRTSVKLDLQDRTVLEGEALISHILRQNQFQPVPSLPGASASTRLPGEKSVLQPYGTIPHLPISQRVRGT